MKFINSSKEAENLSEETLALHEDMNENINFVLKDSSLANDIEIKLYHLSKKDEEIIILIVNNKKIYKENIGNSTEEKEILKKLRRMKKINVVIWAKDITTYPIIQVKYKKIREKDLKSIMDIINP